jgi:hypothetical protein
MKRIYIFILAVMLALGASSAVAQERSGADLTYDRAAAMGQYMRQLVMGDYLDIKQTPESLKTIARNWAAGITDSPRLVVQLDVENQSHVVTTRGIFSQEPPIVGFEAVSDAEVTIWQYLARSAGEESGVTGASYQEIMQVNGQINASTMYAEEGREGTGMYILLYEDAAPILLLVNAENGAVSITGLFLPSVKLQKCQNYGQVSLYLMLNGFGMSCQEILGE